MHYHTHNLRNLLDENHISHHSMDYVGKRTPNEYLKHNIFHLAEFSHLRSFIKNANLIRNLTQVTV